MVESKEYEAFVQAALLLHATLFSFQKAYGKMVGQASKSIVRYSLLYLDDILRIQRLPVIDKKKSIEENMAVYISMVKKTGYIGDASLSQKSENSYLFEIKNCRFATRGHEIFKSGLICPFAVLAASVIFHKTDALISVGDSKFSNTGSRTIITMINTKTSKSSVGSDKYI